MKCPECGLISHESAQRCDCGYDFASGEFKKSYLRRPDHAQDKASTANRTEKHPWPRSWPPFWRAILHVAIATGVGNAAFGVGIVLLFIAAWLLSTLEMVVLLVTALPLSWGTTILTALVPALLMRVPRRTRMALVRGFSVGWAIVGLVGGLLFSPLGSPRTSIPSIAMLGLVTGVAAVFLGSYLIATVFASRVAEVDSKRITMSRVVGGCLLCAANAWACVAFPVGIDWMRRAHSGYVMTPPPLPGWCLNPFTVCVWSFGLFNLGYAVMAQMLISAVKPNDKTEKELDEEAKKSGLPR